MTWADDKKTYIIKSLAELQALLPAIQAASIVAVDTESTGLGRFDLAVGVGLCWSATESLYIPISIYKPERGLVCPWQEKAYLEMVEALRSILTASKRVIGHNIVFDTKIIENTFGFNILDYILADTQYLYHTAISEEGPLGLKAIAGMHIDPDALSSQDDLKEAVIEAGGSWTKDNKEFWRGPYGLLGRYCCMDTLYTYAIYHKFYVELAKQNLTPLWDNEVMPLLKVTYDLNTVGMRIDVPYFEQLKVDMTNKIEALEDELYAMIETQVTEYETKRVLEEVTITPRSAVGKLLTEMNLTQESNPELYIKTIKEWFRSKNQIKRIFNLSSNDDKAFLLYDILGFTCETVTKTGKRSVTKATLEKLEETNGDHPVIRLIADRSLEIKMLNTYVQPFLDQHINGRIYPSFNQTGTIAGRYSSNSPNFQNIPRKDKRIKKGIIVDDDYVFVNADFSSLEPRCFAEQSGDDGLKKVYRDNLDLYSKVGIDVLGLKNVSADPKAPNYLKTVDEASRDKVKIFVLQVPYGTESFKLSKDMSIPQDEAQDLIDNYLGAYPELAKFMEDSRNRAKKLGYVANLMGRRRRFKALPLLYGKYGVRDFSYRAITGLYPRLKSLHTEYLDAKQLYGACRNELNNSTNFRIQSLAASVVNAAAIELRETLIKENLNARICLNVHDELCVLTHKDNTDRVKYLLQHHMENNKITKMISVPMVAEPKLAQNLLEAK